MVFAAGCGAGGFCAGEEGRCWRENGKHRTPNVEHWTSNGESAALVLSVLLLMAGAAFGSETVIVPYDATKPIAGQKPDQFYLPYERFLELWEAAKKNRTGAKAEPAAVAYVLSAARYEGVVGERSVAFTGKLDVTTYNGAWVKVPLPFKDVQIGALKIDGVAAAYDGAEIIVEKPGRHAVEVAFEIPLKRGTKAFAWGVPRTGATLVTLTLPDARMRAVDRAGQRGDRADGRWRKGHHCGGRHDGQRAGKPGKWQMR